MIWRDRKLNLVIMAPSPQHPCCSSTLPHPLLSYPCIYPFPYPFHAGIFPSLSYLYLMPPTHVSITNGPIFLSTPHHLSILSQVPFKPIPLRAWPSSSLYIFHSHHPQFISCKLNTLSYPLPYSSLYFSY